MNLGRPFRGTNHHSRLFHSRVIECMLRLRCRDDSSILNQWCYDWWDNSGSADAQLLALPSASSSRVTVSCEPHNWSSLHQTMTTRTSQQSSNEIIIILFSSFSSIYQDRNQLAVDLRIAWSKQKSNTRNLPLFLFDHKETKNHWRSHKYLMNFNWVLTTWTDERQLEHEIESTHWRDGIDSTKQRHSTMCDRHRCEMVKRQSECEKSHGEINSKRRWQRDDIAHHRQKQ